MLLAIPLLYVTLRNVISLTSIYNQLNSNMQQKPLLSLMLSAVLLLQLAQTQVIPSNLSAFRAAELKVHNDKRALHGCSALTNTKALNDIAQKYAKEIATNKTMAHSQGARNGTYGENIYWGWASSRITYINGTASNAWYSEVANYNYISFNSTNPSKPVGHFTAMIWKNVTSVGFGFHIVNQTINGRAGQAVYIVANYAPTPNVRGRYAANVPRLFR